MAGWMGRARHWTRTIVEFGLAQGFGQAAGMLAGLIYVRTMPVEQYALYALCLTALSVAAVGSDLGVTGSLGYFWRKSLQDGSPIAPKIILVRRIRAILFAGAMTIGVALVITSTKNLSTSAAALSVCLFLVVATAWLQTGLGIDILIARLSGRQRESYIFESAGSAVRLGAALAMLVGGFGAAWFGLAGGLLAALATTAMVQSSGIKTTQVQDGPTSKDWREMRSYAQPLIPSVLIYMIQDPLVLWLAAVHGGAKPVAEVHALGRIAAILSILGSFVVVVLTPRLAGIKDNRHFARMSLLALGSLATLLATIVMATSNFPSLPLRLIGKTYAHLEREVVLAVCVASLNVLIAFVALANRTKGWVRLEPYVAASQALAILIFIATWEKYDTAGIIWLNLVLAATSLFFFSASTLAGALRPDLIRSNDSS